MDQQHCHVPVNLSHCHVDVTGGANVASQCVVALSLKVSADWRG